MNRIAPMVGALALALAIGGCGTDVGHTRRSAVSPAAAQASRLTTPPAPRIKVQSRFAQGLPRTAARSTFAPPLAGSPAGEAAASIPAVVELHDLASTIVRHVQLPPGAIHGEASDLAARFTLLNRAVRTVPGGAATDFSGALIAYGQISGVLGSGQQRAALALASRLVATDRRWRRALAQLSGSSHTRLTTMIPPLLPIRALGSAPTPKGR